MPKKKGELSIEERLEQSIVAKEEEPYKLPSNWVWTRLGDITDILNGDRGKNYPSKDKLSATGEIPFISAGNLEDGQILKENLLFLNNEQYEKLRAGKLKEDDLLFCIRGSLGKFGKNYFSQGAIASSLVIVRNILKNKETINFIENYFRTLLLKNEIAKYNNGTAQPNLSAENLKKFLLPLPPLEEQKRIVEKLDSLFEKIQKIKEIIEEVKEKTTLRREAILSKAFSGELTEKWRGENHIENARKLLFEINDEKISLWEDECKKAEDEGRKKPAKPKLKTIDEMLVGAEEEPYKLPNNWVWTRLGDISLKLTDGSHNPPKNQNSNYRMLSAKNIFNRKINFFEDDRRISKEDFEKENIRTKLENNDILLTIVGTIGRTALVKETDINLTFQRSVAVIKTFILQEYLELFMNSKFFNQELYKNAKGTAQLGVYLNKLKDLKIVIPPLEEQKEIVRVLDKVFEEENRISELISLENKIEILEKTILDRAFRGELGTGNSDDEPAIELLRRCLEER